MSPRQSKTASARGNPPEPKSRFERHPRLTLCVIVLVLLALTIGAVEWGLTHMHERLNLSLLDERGETRLLRMREWPPGTVKVFGAPENRFNDPIGPVDRAYELRIDERGFIWPSLVYARPDFEIVFLGGSTTECLYVRPTMRFPYLVGRILEAHSGLKINSLNAGKSGNHTMHAILDYLGKVAPRRPRFVALMEAANDIGLLNREESYWNDDKNLSLLQYEGTLKGRQPISDFMRRVREGTIPYTYRLVRRGLDSLNGLSRASAPTASAPVGALPGNVTIQAPDEAEVRRRKILRASYEPALRSFVRLAKAWGSEPILMTQVRVDETTPGNNGASDFLAPDALRRGNFDHASFASLHDFANAVIRHVAVTEGAILIDLASARRWTREDVYDGFHFTETGSRRVAEIIAGVLMPVLDRPGATVQHNPAPSYHPASGSTQSTVP